jgi:GT2 family glycosyltransferase
MMCDVSIIIVNWNTKEYLRNCLDSIHQAISGIDAEIIVVDNASEDGSVEMVQMEFPSVKLINNCKNLGFAKANNIGIASSVGNYLCLINSDVIVDRNCIKELVGYLKKNKNVGMAGPTIKNSDGIVQTSCKDYPTLWNMFSRTMALDRLFPNSQLFGGRMMTYWTHDAIQSVEVLSGCFWCVRREALDSVGMLDENFFLYAEDIDWCKRYRDAGWDVVFYPGAEATHFGGASSANAPIRFYIEMHKADLQYWEKHHGKFKRYIYNSNLYLFHFIRIVANSVLYVFPIRIKEERLFKIKRSAGCIKWLVIGYYR